MGTQCVNLKDERIGEQRLNQNGEMMEIIKYQNSNNIVVKFLETGYTTKCSYTQFKTGTLKDKTLATIYGVGSIGDTAIVSDCNIKKQSYTRWEYMMRRCYGYNTKQRTPRNRTYENCTVCDEWLCYANFEKWYDKNYYEVDNEQMCLDKDILVKGNKVYSPDTAIFVPARINLLFVAPRKGNKYPIGVNYRSDCIKKYNARLRYPDGHNITKSFYTPEEAFEFYKQLKEELIKQVADEYKEKIPQRLYDALYAYKIEITD